MRLSLFGTLAFISGSLAVDNLSNIVGGKPVAENGLPFMAHLMVEGKPECGGALIGDKWIVTAAHCLVKSVTSAETGDQLLNIAPSKIQVILGTIKPNSTSPYSVVRYSLEPGFDYLEYKNDVAVIELSAPVVTSQSIRPIGISQKPIQEKQIVTAAGWGSTGTQNLADTLYEVNLEVGTAAKCATVVQQYEGLDGPKICVANSPGRDTCFGDSGGPLFHQEDGHYSILGVTSYGLQRDNQQVFKCGGNDTYGVYTRLASFSTFIKNVTGLTDEQLTPGYYSASSSVSDIPNNATSAEKNSDSSSNSSNSGSSHSDNLSGNLVTVFALGSVLYSILSL